MSTAGNGKPNAPKQGKPGGKNAQPRVSGTPAQRYKAKAAGKPAGGGSIPISLEQLRAEMHQLARGADRYGTDPVDFEQVMGAILDPFDHAPFRYPVDSDRPTSVNRLFDIQPAGSSSAGSNALPLAANCGFAAVFRDPRRAAVQYEAKSSGNSRQYNLYFEDDNGALQSTTNGPGPGDNFSPVMLKYISGWKCHGQWLACSIDHEGNTRFYWETNLDASTGYIIFTGLAVAPATYAVEISWELNGVTVSNKVTLSPDGAGTATYTIPTGAIGRFGIRAITDMSAQTSVGVAINANCPYSFKQMMLPEFEDQFQVVDTARINCASLLMSDRTAAIYAQGSIVQVQVAGSKDWAELAGLQSGGVVSAGNNNYGVVAKYQMAKNGPYHKGRYNPLKYTGPQDLLMRQITSGSGANKYMLPMIETEERGYVAILYDATNATQLAGQWTMCWHVEFETISQWRDCRAPHMHPRVFEDAQHALVNIEIDFENNNHLKKIGAFLKGALKLGTRVGAAALPFMSPGGAAGVRMGLGIAKALM